MARSASARADSIHFSTGTKREKWGLARPSRLRTAGNAEGLASELTVTVGRATDEPCPERVNDCRIFQWPRLAVSRSHDLGAKPRF